MAVCVPIASTETTWPLISSCWSNFGIAGISSVDDYGLANPTYADALNGITQPRGSNLDPTVHSLGDTANSGFTSWTPNQGVAYDFATGERSNVPRYDLSEGVILTIDISQSKLVEALKSNNLDEMEYLLGEAIKGAAIRR